MVLGSEVSWLSSTFNVVSFFNIPAIESNTHLIIFFYGTNKNKKQRPQLKGIIQTHCQHNPLTISFIYSQEMIYKLTKYKITS
jgi:hypothetical protein